jgi:hypothetical protein
LDRAQIACWHSLTSFTLPLMLWGLTKLPVHLSKYKFAPSHNSFLQSFAQDKIAVFSAWNTVACTPSEMKCLLLDLTPHRRMSVPDLPAILDPSV